MRSNSKPLSLKPALPVLPHTGLSFPKPFINFSKLFLKSQCHSTGFYVCRAASLCLVTLASGGSFVCGRSYWCLGVKTLQYEFGERHISIQNILFISGWYRAHLVLYFFWTIGTIELFYIEWDFKITNELFVILTIEDGKSNNIWERH